MKRLPTGLVLLFCVSCSFSRERVSSVRPILQAERLEKGKCTLQGAFDRLGAPDLMARSGQVDRAYWISSERSRLTFHLRGREIGANHRFTFVSENLHMARLEFDRAGVLRDVHTRTFSFSRDAALLVVDDRVAEQIDADHRGILGLSEPDDEDDDE